MKTISTLSLTFTLTVVLAAASLPVRAEPAAPASADAVLKSQTSHLKSGGDAATPVPENDEFFAAAAGEPQLFPRLRGVRFIAEPAQLTTAGFPAEGVDTALLPALNPVDAAISMSPFMDRPASEASLQRLVDVMRAYLRGSGRPFTSVYLPPQDVTDGYVQVVVAEARSAGPVTVSGAKHFSAASYRAVLRQDAGVPIDATQAQADVAWLNRNPYRRAELSAESGREPGTTQLVLLTRERFPLALNAGYSNTGTQLTDENRVSAGLVWANAFGRGDLLNLGATGDPAWDQLRSYSMAYTAFLPWRHVMTLQAAHSEIDSVMPEPFTQAGTSWQVTARYEIPLAPPREGWTQSLSFGGDFKYSDNTLEFAAIPVTDNVTHVAQVGATYGVTFPLLGGRSSATLSGYASPGGLTRYNKTRAFRGSRPGAQADYVYGKLTLTHQRALPLGFTWSTLADFQLASGALLGSEQLSGAGAYAVRGYRESGAFGDEGVVVNNELHAPGFGLVKGSDRVDLFAFVDAASLRLRVDRESVELASAGLGVNYAFGRHFSLRAAYGWQLKAIDSSRGVYSGHGHLSANLSW